MNEFLYIYSVLNRQNTQPVGTDIVKTGVTNNGCVAFRCARARAGTLTWLTGTAKWNEAIMNVISHTCDFPAMRKVCVVGKCS